VSDLAESFIVFRKARLLGGNEFEHLTEIQFIFWVA
jgi:hypothetical protein